MPRYRRSPVPAWIATLNLGLAGWLIVSPSLLAMSRAAASLSVLAGLTVGVLAGYNRWITTGRNAASVRVALAALLVAHAVLLLPALASLGLAATVSALVTGTLVAAGAGVNLTSTPSSRALLAG